MFDIILVLIFCAVIGWAVHKLMGKGNHGTGLLHYAFVGGSGSGLGALMEWITGKYTTTLLSTIGLCIVCSCIVEFIIRRIKHWLWVRKVHKLGFLTQDDLDGELQIMPDDLKGFEDIELE